MKPNYFCQVLIILASTTVTQHTFAQFLLDYNQFIHPGDSVSTVTLDTTNFSAGNAGTNVLWDYSSINVTSTFPQTTYYTPGSPTYCMTYPSNIAYGYSNSWPAPPSYKYIYYLSDSTQFSYVGKCELMFGFGSNYIKYSDSYAQIVGPLSYQDSTTDTFSGLNVIGINLEDTTVIDGYTHFIYDAYGELRLPWGTFHNVARIKMYTFHKDSVLTSTNGPWQVRIYNGIGYSWYDYNHRGWIFGCGEGVTTEISNGGQVTNYNYKAVSARTYLPTGLNTPNEAYGTFKLFPNPSNGQLTIQVLREIIGEGNFTLIVSDLSGRKLLSQVIADYQNIISIDLSSASKGMYFATITNENIVISDKFILE